MRYLKSIYNVYKYDHAQHITLPNVKAIKYGREHEGLAGTCYKNLQKCRHTNFQIELTGLHIDARFPALGASPDTLVNGKGVLEIKCPEKYMIFSIGKMIKNFP